MALAFGLVLTDFAGVSGAAAHPVGSEAFLDRLEARIELPADARHLNAYWRSYFPTDGGKKVHAVYSVLHPPGRQWVDANPGPFIADGGCAIITVVVDVGSEKIESVECNGVG